MPAAVPPRLAVAAAALAVATRRGLDPTLPVLEGLAPGAVDAAVAAAGPLTRASATPDLLGAVLERSADRDRRRTHGAYFTPRPVAEHLVRLALAGRPDVRTIVDPAAGGGAFLLAAARWLSRRGVDRAEVVEEQVAGIDLDPLAVLTASSALLLWAREGGADPPAARVTCADGLALAEVAAEQWGSPPIDAVLGNPPFQNQLGSATARSGDDTRLLRERLGPEVRPYTDTAALFLLVASRVVTPGGVVCLVLPQSVLGARDAGPVRAAVTAAGRVEHLWVGDRTFADAEVAVCAPVVGVGSPPRRREVVRHEGTGRSAAREPVGVDERALTGRAPWTPLLASRRAVPPVDLGPGPRLGDRWWATAGFRDQYYGISGLVSEAGEAAPPSGTDRSHARLLTCGLVDPLRALWGTRPATLHRRRWERPVVDVAALDPDSRLGRWAARVLVPKVVVATQTRVVEAVPDPDGRWWPSVPALTVGAAPAEVWHAAAVLSAPPVSAWLWRRRIGTALSHDALALSPRDLEAIPLPEGAAAWDRGAAAARAAYRAGAAGDATTWGEALAEVGAAMCDAYGASGAVHDWWAGRLPPFR